MLLQKNKIRNVSVVGRNFYSALCLDALHKESNLKLSWYQHKFDFTQREDSHWLYVPDMRKLSFPISEALFIKPKLISVYLDGGRRIPLPRFLEEGLKQDKNGSFPLAPVRNKIYATAIWNDLTPSLWTGGAPNSHWPQTLPHSLSIQNWKGAALIPREKALQNAEEFFQKEGVDVAEKNKHVLSLELGSLGDDNHLLHNAPHSYSRSELTLWNTPHDAKLKAQSPLMARWVSYYTEVDKLLLAPLPLLSIWLHENHESEFLETGLISTQCMSRVFVIPQSHKNTALLQIQELEFLPIRNRSEGERIDRFLWQLCPYLEKADLKFQKTISDEDSLFGSPKEILQKIGRKSYFYWQGPMGNPNILKAKLL